MLEQEIKTLTADEIVLALIGTIEDLKQTVDQRLYERRERLANCPVECPLEREYMRGCTRELSLIQDLLCIILKQPRTFASDPETTPDLLKLDLT